MYFLCEETDNTKFQIIENILETCSEGFNFLHLAQIKNYRHYKLSVFSDVDQGRIQDLC